MWRNGINLVAALFMTGWAGVGVGAQAPAADAKNFFEIRVCNITAGKMETYKMYQDPAFRSVGSPVEAGLDKPRIIILTNPTKFSKLQ